MGKTSGKHVRTEELVRSICKFAKSVTEISSKIQESKTSDKAINNPVHRNKWQKIMDEKLWNLNSYQT